MQVVVPPVPCAGAGVRGGVVPRVNPRLGGASRRPALKGGVSERLAYEEITRICDDVWVPGWGGAAPWPFRSIRR